MALFYNTDGTVSNVVINAIIDGKVTSSLATTSTIQQSFEASASNAIIVSSITAGSSSNQAYELAYPSGSANNAGYTYLSSATVQKTYSTNSYAVLNPNDPNANKGDVTPIMVDSTYEFVNDLDLIYGKDSVVSVVNDYINTTTSSFATAITSILPNYKITGSIENDADATAASSWLGYILPTGSLYTTSAGVLRVKIS